MPAYFSLCIEAKKSPTAIDEFYSALIFSGFSFISGLYESEGDTLPDITEYNQMKLNENFEHQFGWDFSLGYRATLFALHDFTEVRVFVLNDSKAETFRLNIIIPEDDFLEYGVDAFCASEIVRRRKPPRLRYDKMDYIKNVAVAIWELTNALSIQTEWELSNVSPSFDEIKRGVPPQAEPFCIIPRFELRSKWGKSASFITRDGALIEKKNNWNCVFRNVDS